MFASTIATALIVPIWLLITWWFSLGYSDYDWDSRCYEGQPAFVVAQAALALTGSLAAAIASVGTFVAARRTRRAPSALWVGFGLAGACLVAWVAVVAAEGSAEPCGYSQRASTASTSAPSSGLGRWSSMPAARQRSRSPSIVIAMIGTTHPRRRSSAVAAKPSSSGISQSMKTAA